MTRRLTLKNYDQETQLFTRRLLVTALLVGLLAFGLIVRLYYLQIIQHGKYSTLSIRNQMALIPIESGLTHSIIEELLPELEKKGLIKTEKRDGKFYQAEITEKGKKEL